METLKGKLLEGVPGRLVFGNMNKMRQWKGMRHAYLRRNLWIPKSFSGGKKMNANVTALN